MLFLLIIITIVYFLYKNNKIEHYLDRTPTYLLDNISRCYTKDCVIEESFKCHQYCNTIEQENARENCKMGCEDFGDLMFKDINYEYAIFGNSINKLSNYSLLNE